ncbi:MAG: hypothetical protein FJ318_01395 [SAR202 cluster bacterium]|nr:hypothetical protein [SAR202 cluster bacterium]
MTMTAPGIEQARNVELVAYHDLNGRPGFKMAMQVVDGRWYLHVAHLWDPGWGVVDVTDPRRPSVSHFEPWRKNTWTIQVQVADGLMVCALEAIAAGAPFAETVAWGFEPSGPPHEAGILLWDVLTPTAPKLVSHFNTGGSGTHRNFYVGGRYAYLAAGVEGFAGNILVIADLSDRAHPVEVGRWWFPGQWLAGGEAGTPGVSLHGPAYVDDGLAYLPYGKAGMVIVDVSDPTRPRFVSRVSFGDLGGFIGLHTVLPIPRRKLAVVNSEAILEDGLDFANYAAVVDIADARKPRIMSLFPTPAPEPGMPYRNFVAKGGRFGPHNQHMPHHQPHLMPVDNLVHMTYFNAGLRVYDISDPYMPTEVGHFVPADPTVRRGPLPTKLVTQSEDVLVDARGYIYVTDKNHGLLVLRYVGPGAPSA